MNKSDLVSKVADNTGVGKKDVEAVLDNLGEFTQQQLKAGEKVRLPGIGTFESVHKPAGKGRNPQTGEEVTVAARNVPKFKASADFKRGVNGGA